MDLDSYLFEPLSTERGNYIGRRILEDLATQEPRINIIKIKVNVNFDDNSYGIMVFYEIPKINKKFSTDFLLKAK